MIKVPNSPIPPNALDTVQIAAAASTPDEITATDPDSAEAVERADEPPVVEVTKDQLLRQQRRARRLSRYEEVMRLHQEGVSVRQIAQQLGLGRQTVRRYLKHTTARFPRSPSAASCPVSWIAGSHTCLNVGKPVVTTRASSIARCVSKAIPAQARWCRDGRRVTAKNIRIRRRRQWRRRLNHQRSQFSRRCAGYRLPKRLGCWCSHRPI